MSDGEWNENLNKLEGQLGIDIAPNDRKDVISRIIKAVKDRDKLPADMDYPESHGEVEEVNNYADRLYDLGCELASVAEEMMIGKDVERKYHDIMEDAGECMDNDDRMRDAGHLRSDF